MGVELRYIGKYELRERLERTNAGESWKAYDPQSQRYVTLKLIYTHQQADSDTMKQLVHEVEQVASFHHPNIVQILDFYIFPSRNPDSHATSIICIITDYIEGHTLADYIRSTPSTGKIPPGADIVHLFTPLSLAIDYVHQQGSIHGNIKPANILLNKNAASQNRMGEPMLTDFGFTRLLLNHSGNASPFYLSPEQIKSQAASERSDTYSLGVILYELCTGVLPFRGNRPVSIMIQHVSALPTPPALMNPTISPALANVILRSLAKDPKARFPSASSLTIALAQSLNMPVPEPLAQSAFLPDTAYGPSHNASQHPMLTPGISHSPFSSPHSAVPYNNGLATSAPLAGNSSDKSSNSGSPKEQQTTSAPLQTGTMQIFPAAASLKQRRPPLFGSWYIIVSVALLFIILGTLGIIILFPRTNAVVVANQLVGHAFFLNSGQLSENGPQGINDELQIDLSNIPNPSAGKSYYAWILSDKNQSESVPILIGRLTLNHGNVHFLYKGDQQHTNLLALVSRFLITEDSTSTPSANALLDTGMWRYYGEIPQAPSPVDQLHFSMLDHLRHLLVESPELRIRGLHGGLALWFARNISTISELANNARDDWHRNEPQSIHDQVVSILDYLDGKSFVRTDVPPGTPLLADPRNSQVALLGPAPNNPDPPGYVYNNEVPPGYVYLIAIHMNGAIQSPQTTPDQRKLAIQINAGLDNVRRLLEAVQHDAKQLLSMSNVQLLQPSSLSILDDLATQAQYAYTGQLNPSTGQSEGGAIWIYGNLQRLTTFDVKQYTPVT